MIVEPFSHARFVKFFEKVELAEPPVGLELLGYCWLWQGSIGGHGYGRFHCPGFPAIDGGVRKKNVLAHRWAAVYWLGEEALQGQTWDHQCRRTDCVNPWHGSVISLSENTARGNQMRHVYIPDDPFEALGI